MASAANLELLDQLGPVLCRLSGEAVSLSWSPEIGGFYTVALVDCDTGAAFTGNSDTPSEALMVAAMKRDARRLALTNLDSGFAVDA